MASAAPPSSWTAPGAGITANYNSHDASLRIFVTLFTGLALYNAVELVVIIFLTFKHRRGLYFWSLLVASIAIIPYELGFSLKFLEVANGPAAKWVPIALLTLGWWPMIVGQAMVLWSRLHLIVVGPRGDRIIAATRWMIVATAVCLLIPTTVLTVGSTTTYHRHAFSVGYNVMEKVQMVGFCLQEFTLSSVYIVETVRILRTSLQPDTRTFMRQLIAINVAIIVMDLALLGLEGASLYIVQIMLKGVVYAVKLKLELAILGKLIAFVSGPRTGSDITVPALSMSEHAPVDPHTCFSADRKHPSPARQLSTVSSCGRPPPMHRTDWAYDLARFEHGDAVTVGSGGGSTHSATPLHGIPDT